MNKITKCENCRCKPVCKHVEQWSKYCEEHISLRKQSVLFDEEPVCKFYIENVTKISADTIKTGKIEKAKAINENIWIRRDDKTTPPKITFNNEIKEKTTTDDKILEQELSELLKVMGINNWFIV